MRKLLAMCMTLGLLFAAGTLPAHGAEGSGRTLVKLETSMGEIMLELYPDKAPKTVENFLEYVKAGGYDGTIFHRVINGFMIQGGGFEENMKPRPTRAPIRNEANNGLKNAIYTVAMARTGDPHSATNQFFINVANNDFLNYSSASAQGWGYAVFGKVVDGTDVVNKIKAVPTRTVGFHENVPQQPVVITRASIFTLP